MEALSIVEPESSRSKGEAIDPDNLTYNKVNN
jgi:hypothetical protein